jgi:cell division protein FtsZ
MDFLDYKLPIITTIEKTSIIKVIGVGGGGGNAVNNMYKQGIPDVSFVVCNTDRQDLRKSLIPTKIQLGKSSMTGLGAGGKPEAGQKAAEESIEDIRNMLSDNTKMVFITAGMGGGTGTGASPVIAEIAQEMGILTVGIVTIPFAFEGNPKIKQALEGVVNLGKNVDAILVINNEKLKDIYPDLELSNAFAKADDTLTKAAKAIAEIITDTGYINIDFADVNTIMRNGKVAIMNTGFASGENRITKAIEDALNSPLLNTANIKGAKKILLSLYCSNDNQIRMDEITQIHDFMSQVGNDVTVIWGASFNDELGDDVKITIIATGFDVKDIPGMPSSIVNKIYKNNETEQDSISLEFENETDEEEKQQKKDNEIEIDKAINELYGESVKTVNVENENQPIIEFPISPDLNDEDVVDIADLDDEENIEKLEEIPAWKRKLFRK